MTGFLEIASVVSLISSVVYMVRSYIHSLTACQVIDYTEESSENTDPWRWRQPSQDLGVLLDDDASLNLKDGDGVSSLLLPQRFSPIELLVHLLGYFLMGMAVFLLLDALIRRAELMGALFGFALLVGIGWVFLQLGDRIIKIDLYPHHMELTTKYAIFLYRRHRYRPHKRLKFKGKLQSLLGMERSQIYPDYKITIQRPSLGLSSGQRTFYLTCNKTQGSWIVKGLAHWNAIASEIVSGEIVK